MIEQILGNKPYEGEARDKALNIVRNILHYKTQKGELKVTKKARPTAVSNEMATKILRTVPRNNAFYFFIDIGQYSGKFAVSLADFCEKIKRIDIKSVDFHFKRRDFQKWIRTTIVDVDLANSISNIKKPIEGAALRDEIHQTVRSRLTELKRLLASEDPYVEHE